MRARIFCSKTKWYIRSPRHGLHQTQQICQETNTSIPISYRNNAIHSGRCIFFCKTRRYYATLGYFQLALDEESSYLTTFLIPSGRYRYLRAPMGLSSSSDKWCRCSDFVIEGCEFAKKIVDDILIWAPSLDKLEQRIIQILERCATINVTISKKKFTIGTEIPFARFLISDNGIKPDPQKTVAIASFPPPKNITDLRSFLGLANQLAFFLPDFSHLTCEMRKLLSMKNAFLWLETHQNEFEKLKQVLTSDLLVKIF